MTVGSKQKTSSKEHGWMTMMELVDYMVKLSDQLNAVKKQNAQMEAVIESSFDGIVIVDGDGILLRVNKSYENIVGIDARQYIGQNMYDLQESGVVSQSVSLLVIEKKKPVTLYQQIVSGKEILVTGSPIMDKQGKVSLVITNARDISELNNLKAQVEKSKSLNERYYAELKELRSKQLDLGQIVAHSDAMRKTIELAVKVSHFKSSVLITGESGTGKEVVSKLIHSLSHCRNGPFVQINCGAIPENLLESELFGYEKGAFTGAKPGGKVGLLEMANEGTVLLDEISELPLNLQVKLLRAIQEQEVYRVGGTIPIKLNVRIIATTNKDLTEMLREEAFREDLFYRLNVVPIHISPLREREDDIIPLSVFFLNKINSKYHTGKRFAPEITRIFKRYAWPGNVREMENLIEQLVVLSEDDIITSAYLPEKLMISRKEPEESCYVSIDRLMPLKEFKIKTEKVLIEKAVEKQQSIRKAAKELGVEHSTLLRKIKKYNIKV